MREEYMSEIIGNEIFEKIQNIGRENFASALDTARRIGDESETVSDGELLDALFILISHLDVANPLLPVTVEIFERFMLKIEMRKTPKGIDREWFHDGEDWSENFE